ncbi:rhodanese-like domain-containing protein [uncultured Algibacter sp.]|uniref:rhodanese-like domain-containing protein n=1 Tax=uncultured Algibacter sp. TaxID=298659 RepID=UPI002617379E|nr:rhodanese-like domain-containing protein [uncultured Algibacter sp.]
MGFFSLLFGNKTDKIKSFLKAGAIVIDVRTDEEYKLGAIKGSENIPLHNLKSKIKDIQDLKKPVITCCASGIRSAKAASILKTQGIKAINGGGWTSLKSKF